MLASLVEELPIVIWPLVGFKKWISNELQRFVPSGARPQNSLLGPGPKTKSQGPGLKNIVTIARYAGKKASLDIRRAVPLFYLTEALGFAAFTKRSD